MCHAGVCSVCVGDRNPAGWEICTGTSSAKGSTGVLLLLSRSSSPALPCSGCTPECTPERERPLPSSITPLRLRGGLTLGGGTTESCSQGGGLVSRRRSSALPLTLSLLEEWGLWEAGGNTPLLASAGGTRGEPPAARRLPVCARALPSLPPLPPRAAAASFPSAANSLTLTVGASPSTGRGEGAASLRCREGVEGCGGGLPVGRGGPHHSPSPSASSSTS